MSKMIDLLKATASEASLLTRLGAWRQAVSSTVDNLVDLIQLVTGGGLLPATGTTTGARPLSGYVTALLQTGDEVFVQGVDQLYYYDASSALPADQLNVVTAVGPGQFIRADYVITQTAWYVDAVAGSDENTGQVGVPLKTLLELTRRFDGKVLAASVTINLAGTFTDPLALHCSGPPVAIISVLAEAPTQNATGSITAAFVPFAPATNVDAKLTDGAQIWAPLIGKRIRMTNGTNVGTITWLAKDLGANVVRVGQFTERSTGQMKTPTNGDTYAVETLVTLVPGIDVVIGGGAGFYAKDINFALSKNAARAFAGAIAPALWNPSQCIFDGCQFSAPSQVKWEQTAGAFIACRTTQDTRFYHSDVGLFGLVFTNVLASQIGSRVAILNTCLGQGASASVKAFDDAEVNPIFDATFTAASVGVYDSSLACEIGGQAIFNAGTFAATYLFGSGNAGTATVTIRAGAQFLYVSKPVITGTGSDAKIGGTLKAWAAVPYIEAANNAMIVAFA